MPMPASSSDPWGLSTRAWLRTRSIEPRYEYAERRRLKEGGGQWPTLAGHGGQIAHCRPGRDGPIHSSRRRFALPFLERRFSGMDLRSELDLETGAMGWAAMMGGLWRPIGPCRRARAHRFPQWTRVRQPMCVINRRRTTLVTRC